MVACLKICLFYLYFSVEFHVKSKKDPNNLAFTNVTLGLHTDNPYYYYVPGVSG